MRPKKEAAVLRRELDRLQKYLGGLKSMRRLPDVVILVDQRRETNAVLEARKLDIPLVSMLDTNCDPDLCDVPIPCNDDAVRSVQLVLGKFPDLFRDQPFPAEANLLHLLLQADLKTSRTVLAIPTGPNDSCITPRDPLLKK